MDPQHYRKSRTSTVQGFFAAETAGHSLAGTPPVWVLPKLTKPVFRGVWLIASDVRDVTQT